VSATPAPPPVPVPLAFAFTDIEGSTRLLERLGAAYAGVLADHAAIIRAAIARRGGREVDTQGDAFFAVFPDAADALRFGVDVQRGLAAHAWPEGATVRVRIGLHAGEAIPTRTGYVGLDVHAGARVAAAAHGGQVLCSDALAAAVADTRAAMGDEPDDESPDLVPLGAFGLKDLKEPVELLQAVAHGLETDFPPPRTLDAPDEPPAPGDPPYPGLVPFGEADADRYFGRAALVAELVERLGRDGFLAIVGASGSGKSSLLRAGLVPAVRARLADAGEPDARIAVLTPTEHPAAALDAALGALDGPPHLVAVDQLEELATLCRDDTERDAFVARLLALHDGGSAVAVALRADLYAALAPHDRLRDLVAAHQAYLGPLAGNDLRAAIEGPAAAGGWRVASGLADLVIADLGDEPGSLPLLAHALRETWERRRGMTLGLRGYLDAGGVRGAIARTAEALAGAMDDRELGAARAILLRLVRPGGEGPDTRRRAPVTELLGADPDPARARDALDRLVAARLVVVDGEAAEVAHEALIREWPRLRGWLDADRGALRLHRSVTDAAADHARSGDDPSLLWRGARLEVALALPPDALTPAERAFLDASRAHEAAEAAEREATRQRELDAARRAAEAERARADEAASANRRLRRRAVALTGLLGLAILLAGAAVLLGRQADDNARAAATNEARAEEQAALAGARELASASDAELVRDPELALLLAMEAVDRLPNPETDRRLRSAVEASLVRARLEGHGGAVHSLSLSGDGRRLATAASDGSVRVWDVASRTELGAVRPDRGGPVATVIAPDGATVFAITDGGELWSWDIPGGEGRGIPAHAALGTDIAISDDGTTIVTADEDGVVQVWRVDDPRPVRSLGEDPGRAVEAVAVSPDGSTVVAADPGWIARVWDVRTGELRSELVGHEGGVIDAAFDPDGRRIATAGVDETARIWDAATGGAILVLRGHTGPLTSVAFSSDGGQLVSTSEDGTAIAWDAISGEQIAVMRGHAGTVSDAVASAETGIMTAGMDGSVRLWAREAHPASRTYAGFPGSVLDVAMSPDGRRVLATGADATARVFDAETETEQVVFRGHEGLVVSAAFSPDGASALTVGTDGAARLWDTTTGEERLALTDGVASAALSPDGGSIATADDDGAIRIHDARSGAESLVVTPPAEPAAVAWAHDGTWIWVADRTGSVSAWDAESGESVMTLAGDGTPVSIHGLAVSADGMRVATAHDDGSIRTWVTATRAVSQVLRGDWATTWRLRFSPDGSRIAAGHDDGRARAWDAATGQPLITIASDPADVYGVAWSPDGTHLLLANRRRSAATLHACSTCGGTEAVMEVARARVTRGLTALERSVFLHEERQDPAGSPVPATTASNPPAVLPDPTPEIVADADICSGLNGQCDLVPGPYRPSRLRPPVTFTLDTPATGIAHGRSSLLFATTHGDVTVQDGARTYGHGTDGMLRMGTTAADFVAFLREQPLFTVSDERSMTVGGHPAIAVSLLTPSDEPVDLFFVDPLPFAALPNLPTHIVAVDGPAGLVVVTGSAHGPESMAAFDPWFEAFLDTIELPSA
jgi:WD40 repeat protein/class 3 adenylate cyclase